MDEVGTALIAIALVLLAVFVPTAFIGGITGQFYRQFADHDRHRDRHLAVHLADARARRCAPSCFKPHGHEHDKAVRC